MHRRSAVLLATVIVSASGCYRTNYVNLQPPPRDPAAAVATHSPPPGRQHYFLYGTLAKERVYQADGVCGPGNEVRELRTRRTFLRGLVGMLASYYVNIYAPYDLQIVCVPVPLEPTPEPTLRRATASWP